jgi:predicted HD superfamily hydrolase involved in NAD metabolism
VLFGVDNVWNDKKIEEYLENNLKIRRFRHSLGVRDTAATLAQIYGEDVEKAKIAGIVHDCAKNMQDEELIKICLEHGMDISDVYKESPQLLHGVVGAIIANELMEIYDKDILNAISYHTTGREEMSLLEKIIYISDYIEPMRNFPGVEAIRDMAFKDLDIALLKAFDNTIKFVINNEELLHPHTILGRNYIIRHLKKV